MMSSTPEISRSRRVNVCFHGVGRPQRTLEKGEESYWITRDEFLRLVDDFTTWDGLALSFDDGNISDVETVLPALRERGLTATFFVLAGRLDQPGSLTTSSLRELVDAGMTIGNHGWTHLPWTKVDGADLLREVRDARTMIAEVAETPVTTGALPLGRYNRSVLRATRGAGYTTLFTSDRHIARADAWRQARFSVHSGTTPESLRTSLVQAHGLPRRVYSTLNQFRKSWT